MTTMETNAAVWMSALEAANEAGVGGVIEERYGENRDHYQQYEVLEINNTTGDVRQRGINNPNGAGFWNNFADRPENDTDRYRVVQVAPETRTYREFFDTLEPFSYFTIDAAGRDQYVYQGISEEEGADAVIFYEARYGAQIVWKASILETEVSSYWKPVYDDEGLVKKVDVFTANIMQDLTAVNQRAKEHAAKVSELSHSYSVLMQDFKIVNEKINSYAEEQRMCSDYERRIFSWNEELTHKLIGRERTYYVSVNAPVLFEDRLTLPVRARSPEEAIEIAGAMSTEETVAELIKAGWVFDNLTIEIDRERTPHA